MSLDRWIALIFIAFCSVYGYAAFFTMDQLLPPFMQRNPVWPSTFPKILSIAGVICGLVVLLGLEGSDKTEDTSDDPSAISFARLREYKLGQALGLLALMAAYAIALRPLGFLISTSVFLFAGSALLGERRWIVMAVVALLASGCVWLLVQQALGIFLRPFPALLGF